MTEPPKRQDSSKLCSKEEIQKKLDMEISKNWDVNYHCSCFIDDDIRGAYELRCNFTEKIAIIVLNTMNGSND